MKINPYIQVQQVYNTKKAGAVKAAGAVGRSKDGVEISNIGREFQVAKQALAGTPDIRTDVTAPIKAAVDNGTYDVSGESFAEKLWKAAQY